jgi:hypothetical protein
MKLLVLALAVLGLATGAWASGADKGDLTLLDSAAYPAAKCLDGSPAGYYFRNATKPDDVDNWIIFLEGGGEVRSWCFALHASASVTLCMHFTCCPYFFALLSVCDARNVSVPLQDVPGFVDGMEACARLLRPPGHRPDAQPELLIVEHDPRSLLLW